MGINLQLRCDNSACPAVKHNNGSATDVMHKFGKGTANIYRDEMYKCPSCSSEYVPVNVKLCGKVDVEIYAKVINDSRKYEPRTHNRSVEDGKLDVCDISQK